MISLLDKINEIFAKLNGLENGDVIVGRYTIDKEASSDSSAFNLFEVKGKGIINSLRFTPSFNQSESQCCSKYELVVDDVVVATGTTTTNNSTDSDYVKRYLSIVSSDFFLDKETICSPTVKSVGISVKEMLSLSKKSAKAISNNNAIYGCYKGIAFQKSFVLRVYRYNQYTRLGAELDIAYKLED